MRYWCEYHLQLWREKERIELATIQGEGFGLGLLYVGFKAGSHRYVRAAASASDHSSWIQCIYIEVGRSREHPRNLRSGVERNMYATPIPTTSLDQLKQNGGIA